MLGPVKPVNEIIELLKLQLLKTAQKCEKRALSVDNQERHISVAEVPTVVEFRSKASAALEQETQCLNKIQTHSELFGYLAYELSTKKGLFYRIYRGKINKHVNSEFPVIERVHCLFMS
ncbi:MAG: hypothetical protein JSR17_13685 [Proteobacteria bacterium]|nr:hypothetical protein [Pseudomonadota bacterium]